MSKRLIRPVLIAFLIAISANQGMPANAANSHHGDVASPASVHAGTSPVQSAPRPYVKPIRGIGPCRANCIRGMGTDFRAFCWKACG